MEAALMARPKKQPKKETPPKTIGIRASVEWAEWVEGLAKHYRTNVAGIIDRALAEWAKSENYPSVPPERIP